MIQLYSTADGRRAAQILATFALLAIPPRRDCPNLSRRVSSSDLRSQDGERWECRRRSSKEQREEELHKQLVERAKAQNKSNSGHVHPRQLSDASRKVVRSGTIAAVKTLTFTRITVTV